LRYALNTDPSTQAIATERFILYRNTAVLVFFHVCLKIFKSFFPIRIVRVPIKAQGIKSCFAFSVFVLVLMLTLICHPLTKSISIFLIFVWNPAVTFAPLEDF